MPGNVIALTIDNWPDYQVRHDEPEDLDFMFDEELDQLGGGRRNTFSEWFVTTACSCQIGFK